MPIYYQIHNQVYLINVLIKGLNNSQLGNADLKCEMEPNSRGKKKKIGGNMISTRGNKYRRIDRRTYIISSIDLENQQIAHNASKKKRYINHKGSITARSLLLIISVK